MKFSDIKLTTPYLELENIFFDRVKPTPLKKPFLIAASNDAAKLLGVDEDLYDDEKLLSIVNSQTALEGDDSFAMCYAGHQFGHFVPRLGDGRAINFGKVNGYNLQVKGAGQTLYSRQGDGRAVLRSSIREFLMSESMHGLGIESSRALAIIGSDEDVARERWEKGAVVLRLSPTWVRFGTFEYFYHSKEHDKLEHLADYVIEESFPHLKNQENGYLRMFEEIVEKTATLMAKWQSVGFNHGVMNTDNMSIGGFTIDYGPFAFLDDYEFDYICNHTDYEGRYSFGSQPPVAFWNLTQLSVALSPIVNYEKMQEVLKRFSSLFEESYLKIMYKKLGLELNREGDLKLLQWMLGALGSSEVDYTNFFRALCHYDANREELLKLANLTTPLNEWLEAYDARLEEEKLSADKRKESMLGANPKYVLRNHIIQEAIEASQRGSHQMVRDLLFVALKPFDEHTEYEHLCKSAPSKFKNIKLSCSS